MSQIEKLKAKLLRKPSEADLGDAIVLMEAHGWTLARYTGSGYPFFTKPGEPPFTIALVGGRKLKRGYVSKICQRLGLEED